jgi:hypothetical protein
LSICQGKTLLERASTEAEKQVADGPERVKTPGSPQPASHNNQPQLFLHQINH